MKTRQAVGVRRNRRWRIAVASEAMFGVGEGAEMTDALSDALIAADLDARAEILRRLEDGKVQQ